MMIEIVRARSSLTPYFNDIHDRTPYQFKRHAIQNCLYGVDIDPAAVEIAKLRLWLSLVVDEEEAKQIKPLPNLDYKVVGGNSLIGFPFKSQKLHDIEKLKAILFDESDHDAKAKLKLEIDRKLKECFAASRKSLGYEVTFDFGLYFSEVFDGRNGFDVLIANPPYIRQERIKELKPVLAQQYRCYDPAADIYVYFYERAVQLLRTGGALAFITSNKYFRSGYGEKLRGFLGGQTTLRHVIDFGDAPVFEAIAYPSIVILTKTPTLQNTTRVMTWKPGPSIEDFVRAFRANSFHMPQVELNADAWRLESPAVLRLLEKLRKAGKPLREYVNGRFYRGIITGLNEAFVVDRATRDRLIAEDKSSVKILKPLLRGRDVKRWRVEFAQQYLIKIESSENKQHPWSGKPEKEAEKIFAKTYPAIRAHFQLLQEIKLERPDARGCRNLLEKLQCRDDQGKYFWELRSCIYWKEFEQPKIVIPAIAREVQYAADDAGYVSNDKTSICIAQNPGFLLAPLNSKVLWWFIKQIAATKQGGFYEFKPMYVTQVPVPVVSEKQQAALVALVDRILAAKRQDPQADTSALEREIDERVYRLYGVSPDEVKLVEESMAR